MAHDPSLHRTRSTAPRLSDGIDSFGIVSKLNHWISATLFLGALGLGLYIDNGGLTREAIGPYMQWHKALGVAVLIYGLWRVGWRIAQGFPRGAIKAPRWQERVAKLSHIGLLIAILAMPVSGVLMTIAAGRDLSIWGVTLLSAPAKTAWLDGVAGAVHDLAPPVILVLLALHIGAALKHHFIDRDATLRRMV
ncbi:cytochrome b [Roseovarius spongiae]|uniref:Cytochrome b n=1 Tax=Roseovarius spongiae TaxID=2320272 RepID=A0A3A8AWE5_9RHOB|nr:cytochrome b [Roseovarius spongiae]RKF16688.1 cytochrome b [Roseovarius spongiae]